MRKVNQDQHKEIEKILNRKFDYVSPEVYNIVKSKQQIEYNDKNNVKIELVYIQETV